ncbi:Glutamine-dependent NAD(+) synthetase [Rosistilla carotiformis]|uniref:Glutamine-dependent NAD(+) synthetase n=1 Tax=Rosistilla carotiformis TaxID=2528017 RepID=A0A518JNX1_9BACT|nr:NAD(+) synthase [Rosistilla carotiformis]QDV67208.1 Glutamine-dependent NAD(+) synthetase [Rosistilla carotiformis]
MHPHGYVRITAASPPVHVGAPRKNAVEIQVLLQQHVESDIVLFPELSLTGYTAADLFGQQQLLDAAMDALQQIVTASAGRDQLIVVGLPVSVADSLYNCAAAIDNGRLLGIVPKQFLPNYKEFYEARWFRAADGGEPATIEIENEPIPFGIDLLFRSGDAVVGIEICEDLWTPNPPSGLMAVAGSNILLNLSASTETVGKASWRTDLVKSQSGRCIAAYAYAGAGPTESTTDVVFGAHCMVAENGAILSHSRRVGDGQPAWQGATSATVDVDIQKLGHDRRTIGSFDDARSTLPRRYRKIDFSLAQTPDRALQRDIAPRPFVPSDPDTLADRCSEIFEIQSAGLAQRIRQLPQNMPLFIGVSGGLDSTLALVVAAKMCQRYDWPTSRIHGITMPGFGTTDQTRESADRLMQQLGVTRETIDIRPLCLQAFQSLQHQPLGIDAENRDVETLQLQLVQTPNDAQDLVFENIQARIRTFLLMSRGFVLGTGDLSEQALGWSTYNGDHMSMYNVNTSVPKTLVRFLVRFAGDHHFDESVRSTLHQIADAVISPELMPPTEEGAIRQSTEATIGAYELHDFFLFHFIRNGYTPDKILWLAKQAKFSEPYDDKTLADTMQTFFKRFFANQFKRTCVPDGPKVGSVSLSPRGDWRMPSDADPDAWRR